MGQFTAKGGNRSHIGGNSTGRCVCYFVQLVLKSACSSRKFTEFTQYESIRDLRRKIIGHNDGSPLPGLRIEPFRTEPLHLRE